MVDYLHMIESQLGVITAIYSLFVLIYVTGVFLVARLREDNSVMDIFYGPAFAIATWATVVATNTYTTPALVTAGLVTVWALRLGIRIGRKNWGADEDERYAKWRTEWTKRSNLYFIMRSYIQINLLQGIIIVLVSLPMIILIASEAVLSAWTVLGAIVFVFGLSYESIADWQLDAFIARKKAGTEEATLMQQGLFAYSRRPNYFGESMIWCGIALTAVSVPTVGILALVSPLLITYILAKVTGPMLERNFLERYPEKYQAYMDSTNYMIPGAPAKK